MTSHLSPELAPWRAFLVSHSLVLELLERDLRTGAGIPLTWYEVLLHLGLAPSGQRRMGELADRLLLSRSGVTRLIDRMEQAGLVERCAFPGDRRAALAALTDAGRELFERAAPIHLAGVERYFLAHLTGEQAGVLAAALARVARAAAEASGRTALLGEIGA